MNFNTFFLIFIIFIGTSCHWFVDKPFPSKSINFQEQIFDEKSQGLLESLLKLNHTDRIVLAVSPPSGFLKKGQFEGYLDNQEYLFNLKDKDNRVEIICTYDPRDTPQEVRRLLESCFKSGAIGVKTYHTHSLIMKRDFKHPFQTLDENFKIAIDVTKNNNGYFNLFINNSIERKTILKYLKDKDVPVICSHFCFLSNNLKELKNLLYEYPNLFIGFSFLSPRVFHRFLKNINHDEVIQFFNEFSDRLVFESSYVLDDNGVASKDYLYWRSRNQFEFLSKKDFTFYAPPFYHIAENFKGLNLSPSIIEKIYFKNADLLFNRFSNSR